ncbi:MAG TPA: universal stress protein [Kofleriaceae bacterium]|nr:universal stress protein [Kofleriaceae bacterium]
MIGIDFSPLSELALVEALAIATERPRAALAVVHVLPPGRKESSVEHDAAEAEAANRLSIMAAAAAQDAGAERLIDITTHVLRGSAATELVRLADALEADLIVTGRHGWRGMKRLLTGSVADRVLRDASCPVLLVRPRAYDPHPELVPEPPCEECVETRRRTAGFQMWCDMHDKPWVPAHRYSYDSALSAHPYHADGMGGDQPRISASAVPITDATRPA